jgi:hypothetical protein
MNPNYKEAAQNLNLLLQSQGRPVETFGKADSKTDPKADSKAAKQKADTKKQKKKQKQ